MNYKEIFLFKDNYKTNSNKQEKKKLNHTERFGLDNFEAYDAKLDEDFYLRFFIYQVLFVVDILELNEFLEFHYDFSKNTERYVKLVKLKVIPSVIEIIENAAPGFSVGGHPRGIHLGNGFYDDEGIINNYKYCYQNMYNCIGGPSFTARFNEKLSVIKEFIDELESENRIGKLTWIAGPAKLGIIIRELVEMGYIEPEYYRNEVNSTDLSKRLLEAFNVKNCSSKTSLATCLNSGSIKYSDLKIRYDKENFHIPHANIF